MRNEGNREFLLNACARAAFGWILSLRIYILFHFLFALFAEFRFRVIEQSACIQLVLNFLSYFCFWWILYSGSVSRRRMWRFFFVTWWIFVIWEIKWNEIISGSWLCFLIRFNCFYCWSYLYVYKNHCASISVINKIIRFN